MTKLLVEYRADVSIPDRDGWIPLIHAAAMRKDYFLYEGESEINDGPGSAQVVRLLLHAGADMTTGDNQGMTALHHASKLGFHERAYILVQAGADLSIRDNRRLTPLYAAAVRGHQAVLDLLYDWCTSKVLKIPLSGYLKLS